MTGSHDASANGRGEQDVMEELAVARRGALRLLSELSPAPRSLRVQAGGAHIEVEWPDLTARHDGSLGSVPATGVIDAIGVDAAQATPANVTNDTEESGPHLLRAPTVGNLVLAPKPDADPFVTVGDRVSKGQQVAIVKILRLAIPVKADVDGTVMEVLRKDGEPLEHDEPVFAIDTSPAGSTTAPAAGG